MASGSGGQIWLWWSSIRPRTDLAGLAVAPSARPGGGRAPGLAAAKLEAPEQESTEEDGSRGGEGGRGGEGVREGATPEPSPPGAREEEGGGEPAVPPAAARQSRARLSRGRRREEECRAPLPPW